MAVSEPDLAAFVELVVADPDAWSPLQGIDSRDEFCSVVVAAAAHRGLHITADEVNRGLVSARRAWLERWV